MVTKKLSIKDLDIKGKKVLLRVDFNVPLQKGAIRDDTRIRAALPSVQYILDQGGIPILMSHLGRPNGKPQAELSLAPCGQHLSSLLQKPVQLLFDCVGKEIEKKIADSQIGDIFLLENLRFHEGEENPEKEPFFTPSLAQLGDVYVNDAFGCAHRSHASITEITKYFANRSAAGFLLQKEVAYLEEILSHPKKPFYAIIGGAKISTKFKIIKALMQKADALLIGGAMAYTFFKSQKLSVGSSLVENDFLHLADEILHSTSQCRLLLPSDIVTVRSIDCHATKEIVSIQNGIPDGFQGVDIGPRTISQYSQELKKASTIFWNGPVGVFEVPPFDTGTYEIAKTIANLPATTIIGGGDSAAAIEQAGLTDRMSHISTGGGATLEYIELGQLPGIEVLSNLPIVKKNEPLFQ
jgi:3-phosphoglycerate kinase